MAPQRRTTYIEHRAARIRAATPDILAHLFKQQHGVCDLCGNAMQDPLLATIDHSVPVVIFARGPLLIGEAVQQCNAPGNLRAAHRRCNFCKGQMTREQWYKLGLNKNVDKPRVYTDGELLELQFRMGAVGRMCKEKRIGLFAPGSARLGGLITAAKGAGCHVPEMKGVGGCAAGLIRAHSCCHVSRRVFNPKCRLCVVSRASNEPWQRNAKVHSGQCANFVGYKCTNKTWGHRQLCRACAMFMRDSARRCATRRRKQSAV